MGLNKAESIFLTFLVLLISGAYLTQHLDYQGIFTTLIGDGVMAAIVYLLLTRIQTGKDMINALIAVKDREKRRKILEEDLKQIPEGKPYLLYRKGSLTELKFQSPDSYLNPETKKILEDRNIYDLLVKGIEESNKLVDEGKDIIEKFESNIHNKLVGVDLKESLTENTITSEPSYILLHVKEAIYDGILSNDDSIIKIEGSVLKYGEIIIAEAPPYLLVKLETRMKELINDSELKNKINRFNEINSDLENVKQLKEFEDKKNKLLENLGLF